ncbi:CPBP family intramembrane metalloprotease [Paenibacillus thiaminolyticus]|uniref:CPBP family intramembrane glutamic endopeptidase n=1 Tax=Paenibacillus thiaminolyticus TaxID=49283 RepID=UPI00234FEA5C|nr:CPBP family intramembrane glutamic endopeptidase [Paenibacillus thiaminolyticus]WCR26828.1 CPBP family intramembrane metalloprotease [Paenibacillus thiaminolyticus]
MTLQATGSFSKKRPVLTVVLVELFLLLAVFAAGAYATIKQLPYTSPVLIAFIPIALALLFYMTLKKRWAHYGFCSLSTLHARDWIDYAPLLVVLVILSIKGLQDISLSEAGFFLFFTLLVAFVEETIFRGLILRTLMRTSAAAAVITSSVLFSLTHMLNMLSGQNMADTAMQLVYALLVGFALGLLMVKHHNIYPLILFHFVHNFIQFIGNDSNLIYTSLVLLVLGAHCVWLLINARTSASRTTASL